MKVNHTLTAAQRRARRVRASVRGTGARPRVSIVRSNHYTTAQVIDDVLGKTLFAVSSRKLEVSKKAVTKTDAARQTGEALAKQMLAANVTAAVFDRGAYRYHGRVKAVAEALRSAGVQV